jgi:EAL domain-containing protein (putative c-di-GMP-specific phosphodiesterase class I)
MAIVSAIMPLAHGLGSKVVVEGVETVGEFAKLRSLGDDLGQGYYWWRVSAGEEIAWILAQPLKRLRQ